MLATHWIQQRLRKGMEQHALAVGLTEDNNVICACVPIDDLLLSFVFLNGSWTQ